MTPIQRLVDFFGGQAKTASALGVTQAAVSYWVSGTHHMSAAKAFLAEELTSGKVTARDLCLSKPGGVEGQAESNGQIVPFKKEFL